MAITQHLTRESITLTTSKESFGLPRPLYRLIDRDTDTVDGVVEGVEEAYFNLSEWGLPSQYA